MQRRQKQKCEERNGENHVISQARKVNTMNTGACLTLVGPLFNAAGEIATVYLRHATVYLRNATVYLRNATVYLRDPVAFTIAVAIANRILYIPL